MAKRPPKGEMTERHKIFCLEYAKERRADRAAIAAGYTKKNAFRVGFQLLEREDIKKYLAELKEEQFNKMKIDADRVLEEIARIAFADPRKLVQVDARGRVNVTPTDQLTEQEAAALGGIKVTKAGSVEIRFNDKLAALDKLGRHLALFKDVQETNVNFTQMPDVKVVLKDGQDPKTLEFNVGSPIDNDK